jgi:MFS family permease
MSGLNPLNSERKLRMRPLQVACLVCFLQFVGAYMRIPIVPLFARSEGATAAEVGIIVGLFMLVAAVSAIPVGRASDWWGRKTVILFGIALGGLTSLVLPVLRTPGQMMLLYAAAGLGVSAFTPSMISYAGDVGNPGEMGLVYGWITTAQYAGMTLGPALGGLAAGAWGYRSTFLASAAMLAVACGTASWGLPSLPRAAPVGSSAADRHQALREVFTNRTILGCWLSTFCVTFTWGAPLSFFPLYAQDAGYSAGNIGVFFAIQACCNALARVPVGRFLDRVGVRLPFIVTGMLGFALATVLLVTTRRWDLLALTWTLAGLSQGVGMVAVGAALGEATTRTNRGLAMGGFGTAIYSGFALGSSGVGALLGRYGFGAAFTAAAGVSVAGAAACYVIMRGSRLQPKLQGAEEEN